MKLSTKCQNCVQIYIQKSKIVINCIYLSVTFQQNYFIDFNERVNYTKNSHDTYPTVKSILRNTVTKSLNINKQHISI